MGMGLLNLCSMQLWTFNEISAKISFSELGSNFTCQRVNPYHSRESQLSMTLNRDANNCV